MKKTELMSAFKYAAGKNELYDGENIIIPKTLISQFVDNLYDELISVEECKKRKQFYFNYIKKVMHEKEWYINEMTVFDFVNEWIHDDSDFNDAKLALRISKNWSNFWSHINKVFER